MSSSKVDWLSNWDMTAIELDADAEPMTEDEALAYALSLCEPGQSVIIHQSGCSVGMDGEGCDCEAVTLTPGAKA